VAPCTRFQAASFGVIGSSGRKRTGSWPSSGRSGTSPPGSPTSTAVKGAPVPQRLAEVEAGARYEHDAFDRGAGGQHREPAQDGVVQVVTLSSSSARGPSSSTTSAPGSPMGRETCRA
jgi:hypothetical protein